MLQQISNVFVKAAEKLVSMKVLVVILSTVLFYIGKLNQDGWINMVLMVTGIRAINEVAAMYKDIRIAQTTPVNKSNDAK